MPKQLIAGRGKPDDRAFWDWIEANIPQPECSPDTLVDFCNEANALLQRIDGGLVVEVGSAFDGSWEVVISAGGIREHFPAVERLVAAAGEPSGFTARAFRQPRHVGEMTYAGKTFSADDVWYEAYTVDREIGLNLFVSGFDPDDPEIEGSVGFIFLDAYLGEHAVATKIGPIDFAPLPDDPAAQGLKPIAAMADDIAALDGGQNH